MKLMRPGLAGRGLSASAFPCPVPHTGLPRKDTETAAAVDAAAVPAFQRFGDSYFPALAFAGFIFARSFAASRCFCNTGSAVAAYDLMAGFCASSDAFLYIAMA